MTSPCRRLRGVDGTNAPGSEQTAFVVLLDRRSLDLSTAIQYPELLTLITLKKKEPHSACHPLH